MGGRGERCVCGGGGRSGRRREKGLFDPLPWLYCVFTKHVKCIMQIFTGNQIRVCPPALVLYPAYSSWMWNLRSSCWSWTRTRGRGHHRSPPSRDKLVNLLEKCVIFHAMRENVIFCHQKNLLTAFCIQQLGYCPLHAVHCTQVFKWQYTACEDMENDFCQPCGGLMPSCPPWLLSCWLRCLSFKEWCR